MRISDWSSDVCSSDLVADLVLAFQVAEALGDAPGAGDGPRVAEDAVVEPGAGDDVGEKPGVGRAEAVGGEHLPHPGAVSAAHVRQPQVLPVTDADLVEYENGEGSGRVNVCQ